MYQPRAFVGTDPAQLDALFAADPYVTLLTNDGAGEPFASWQAWVPPSHTVSVTPAEAWDALIYVWDASPTERLG